MDGARRNPGDVVIQPWPPSRERSYRTGDVTSVDDREGKQWLSVRFDDGSEFEMMLAAKETRGESSLSATSKARRLVGNYLEDARAAVQKINEADGTMRQRSFWRMLFTNGVVLGSIFDDAVEEKACQRRKEIRALTAVSSQLPVAAEPVPICIEPDPSIVMAAPWRPELG